MTQIVEVLKACKFLLRLSGVLCLSTVAGRTLSLHLLYSQRGAP